MGRPDIIATFAPYTVDDPGPAGNRRSLGVRPTIGKYGARSVVYTRDSVRDIEVDRMPPSPPSRRTRSGWLLLVVMAALGAAMVWLPAQVQQHYEAARRMGQQWGWAYLITVGVGALCFLVASAVIVARLVWRSRCKRQKADRAAKSPSELSSSQIEREIQENLASVRDLHADAALSDDVRAQLAPLTEQVDAKQEAGRLEIVAFGTVSSGKSSLLNTLAGRDVFQTDLRGGTTLCRNQIPWPGADQVILVDTPGLGEVQGAPRHQEAAQAAREADLVLFVVDGPLRESEFQLLKLLAEMEKRILVCLNKEDWYEPDQRAALLGQLAAQVAPFVPAADVVAIRSRAANRRRMRVTAAGEALEDWEEMAADIQPLAQRMLEIVQRDGRDLLLANLLLQSRGLVSEAKRRVRQRLDQQAWQVVERYMWGAGSAAALSPLPLVDLMAGCAISSKMVLDLARVYRQDVDVDLAVNLLGQQGKNLLAVLGTTAATPAVTAAFASLLKSVPGVGTLAGGVLQGCVQAIITRWIGAIFIAYFQDEMRDPPGGLAGLARRQWDQVTSLDELRKVVQSASARWMGRHR